MAVNGTEYCAQHGPDSPAASAPDEVWVWFKMNPAWALRFEKHLENKQRAPRQMRQRTQKHLRQSRTLGRGDRGSVRAGIVDSGSPVFGADGIQGHHVWAANVLTSLMAADYFLMSAQVQEKTIPNKGDERQGKHVEKRLRLIFAISGEVYQEVPTEFLGTVWEEFASSPFGQVRVWANPPREDGLVLHTVNFLGREQGLQPATVLEFDGDNDWILQEVPPSTPAEPTLEAPETTETA